MKEQYVSYIFMHQELQVLAKAFEQGVHFVHIAYEKVELLLKICSFVISHVLF